MIGNATLTIVTSRKAMNTADPGDEQDLPAAIELLHATHPTRERCITLRSTVTCSAVPTTARTARSPSALELSASAGRCSSCARSSSATGASTRSPTRLGIARNVLTARLTRLVDEGVLEQVRYQERPERFEYRLTEKGIDLWPVIVSLLQFGDRYYAPDGPPLVLSIRTAAAGSTRTAPARPAAPAHSQRRHRPAWPRRWARRRLSSRITDRAVVSGTSGHRDQSLAPRAADQRRRTVRTPRARHDPMHQRGSSCSSVCTGANRSPSSAHAQQHLVGGERHRVAVRDLRHLVPRQRRRDGRPLHRPQRVDVDRRLVTVVLAPVDEHLARRAWPCSCPRRRAPGRAARAAAPARARTRACPRR